MSFTVGMRRTAAAGGGLLAIGLALSTHGAATNDSAHAMGGAAITFTSLTLIALCVIRHWVTDTTAERTNLARATIEAENEQMRFLALRAAQEAEMTRLRQDLVTERAELSQILFAERAAMRTQLDEALLQQEAKGFTAGVMFERAGMLEPDAPPASNLIHFPMQHPEVDAAPQRERSREHGTARP